MRERLKKTGTLLSKAQGDTMTTQTNTQLDQARRTTGRRASTETKASFKTT